MWESLAFLGNTFDFQTYLSEEHGRCLPSELPKDVGVGNPVVLKQGLIRTLLLTHDIRDLRFVGSSVAYVISYLPKLTGMLSDTGIGWKNHVSKTFFA